MPGGTEVTMAVGSPPRPWPSGMAEPVGCWLSSPESSLEAQPANTTEAAMRATRKERMLTAFGDPHIPFVGNGQRTLREAAAGTRPSEDFDQHREPLPAADAHGL